MNQRILVLLTILIAAFALAMVACDIEEEAKDVAKDQIDTSFDEDVELELEPVDAEDEGDVSTFDMDCGTTSVAYELERNDIDEDDVDIDSIDLDYVEARYSEATWEPPEVGQVSCVMTLSGDAGEVTIIEENVDKNSKDWSEINVSDNARQFINYYLDHRDEEFSYCVTCTDADSYSVRWYVKIGVTVEGEIK